MISTKIWPVPVAAAALVFLGATSADAATITYTVTLNTTSVSGTSGFLDFQFNPGDNTSFAATAAVLNFNPDGGSLSGSPSVTGNVSGTLPGTVTFTNNMPLNELFAGFTYGSSFSFMLTLSGPAIGSPNVGSTAGSLFGLGLYDNTFNPILTNQNNTTGFVAEFDLNLDGTVTATPFPTANGGASVATLTPLLTPEPGTMMMLGFGALGLLGVRRPRLFPTKRTHRIH